jgi:signal peptidase I
MSENNSENGTDNLHPGVRMVKIDNKKIIAKVQKMEKDAAKTKWTLFAKTSDPSEKHIIKKNMPNDSNGNSIVISDLPIVQTTLTDFAETGIDSSNKKDKTTTVDNKADKNEKLTFKVKKEKKAKDTKKVKSEGEQKHLDNEGSAGKGINQKLEDDGGEMIYFSPIPEDDDEYLLAEMTKSDIKKLKREQLKDFEDEPIIVFPPLANNEIPLDQIPDIPLDISIKEIQNLEIPEDGRIVFSNSEETPETDSPENKNLFGLFGFGSDRRNNRKIEEELQKEDEEDVQMFIENTTEQIENNENEPMTEFDPNQTELNSGDSKTHSVIREILDWGKHILIAVLIGLLLVLFVVQRNEVIGSSMEPNLFEKDQLIVQKISKLYKGGINYGDIVTVNADNLIGHMSDKNIIKRVIGLPGDIIEVKGGFVYRNNVKLEEKYLADTVRTTEREPMYSKYTVPKDSVYVLGDNRAVSLDSRTFGPVDNKRIIGEVLIRFYPIESFGKP